LARVARAAEKTAHPLAQAKQATARFFAEHVLATAPGLLPAIKGGATVVDFDPDAL